MTPVRRAGESPPWRALAVGACLWLLFFGVRHLLAGGDAIAGVSSGNLLWGAGLLLLLALRVFLVLIWPTWLLYSAACFALWRFGPAGKAKRT